jgi:signal transduction histidine kinase
MRSHFLRRTAIFLAVFFGIMIAANGVAFWLLSGGFGDGRDQRPGPPVVILGLGLLLAFFFAGRAIRRVARPVGDVMDAAERVAGGDYSARVAERGPSEMRRLARSFNAMAERLQANEEQRRDLLADVAHELRTPLSVIRANAEAMLDGLYTADSAHLAPVVEETKVMSRLLEDLQTLSTAEAGALRLHREWVEPGQLVADAVAAFGVRAEARGVTLEQRVAAGLPSIEVDPTRLGQVLANLLQNAVQHTPGGGSVVVSAEPAGGGGAVAFSVADTGPGIPPEVLPHVFNRFVKTADSGGAGLGLAIARSLVEALGAEISVESHRGRGTTMRVVLEAAVRPPEIS